MRKRPWRNLTRRNDELCRNATAANKFANILGPVNNNPGPPALRAAGCGGRGDEPGRLPNVGLSGAGTITLGMIASFMTLSRSFVMPLSQGQPAAQRCHHGTGGAERIFRLMDEPASTTRAM